MGSLMNSFAAWFKQLSALQTCVGVAGVVIALFLLRKWLKKPSLAGIVQAPSAATGAASGICAWAIAQGKRLLGIFDYLSTRREWRYGQPWMLVLGEKSSGKTSLLRSVSMSVRQARPARADELQMSGAEWSFFRKGVLIDPDGKFPAAAVGTVAASAWNKSLDELHALRPERPLDGLVLCISARTLSQAGIDERNALAASLYRQLADLQDRIEFMLPLTVVVTQCDCITGFDAFWRSQDIARRSELFGYAATPQAQSSSPGDWADSAFDTINERLRALQVATAANKDRIADVDGFFLFPGHFGHLQAPLRQLLETIFRASAWQAGYLFRGLFFTGSPEAEGESSDAVRADVAFADALLSERVLEEPGLARPTRTGIFSRNGLIRSLQYSIIALAIGLCLAFVVACERVSTQVDVLISAQTQLERTTPEAVRSGDCLDEESVYPLLSEIAHINHNTFYWAIPASWLDRRVNRRSDADIEGGAIGKVLMPTLACALENRARALAAAPLKLPAENDENSLEASRAILTDKLNAVRDLEDNIVRFTKLSEHGDELERGELLSTLANLSKYLFGAELPADVMNERGALSDGFSGGRKQKRETLNMPLHMREDFAGQIKRIARAVRSNLHYEVTRGESLLAVLNRAEPPVLTNTRRFAGWLAWTEKSWAMSTPLSNPCEQIRLAAKTPMDQLVLSYGYDNSLMRELARFDAENCYQPEMQALADLRQAPYGAFFRLRKPAGLTLAAGFKDELVGMPALVQMSFMRLPTTQRFSCLPASEGFRQAELTEAVSYLREYEAFAAKMKLSKDTEGNRPLYDRLARMSLANALDDAMQRSQIAPKQSPYQQVSLEAVMQADQQLSAMGKELTGGLEMLLVVLNNRGNYGDASSVPVLRQCARDFASDSLSRVSALADASRLYAPTPADSGDAMYDFGNLPVLKEYLSRQVARAQVLANYATPFMNLLAGSTGVSATRRDATATAEFWRNSIDELNRYTQGKEPVGQVANLDNYFIRQLSVLTYSNCGKQLASYQSPEVGNDLFSIRRHPLEVLVQQRCVNRRAAQAMEVYGALAQRFNRELSGRYPFGEASARDASSAVVRQFFLDYAQQRAALDEALAALTGDRWRAARQFVSDLDVAAEFFRSNLTAGDGDAGLPIRMRMAFNSQLRPSSGSEQIVSWMLSSGSHAAGLPNRATTLDWQIGEGLALDLSWASRSVWSPVADAQQSDLVVEGNTASFIASKPWALLRMIDRHVVADTGSPSGMQLLLGFALPQQREVSPGKSERGRVSLYLGMTLFGVDPKTQVETKVRLPAKFPRGAPTVN